MFSVKHAREEAGRLQERLTLLEGSVVSMREQISASEASSAQHMAALRAQLEEATQASRRVQEVEEANMALQTALLAAESQAKLASEALAQEVQQHATDTETADKLREQLALEQDACKKIA